MGFLLEKRKISGGKEIPAAVTTRYQKSAKQLCGVKLGELLQGCACMAGSNITTYRTHVAAAQGRVQQPSKQIFQAMEETADI